MYRVTIETSSEISAKYLKTQIEELLPFTHGSVVVNKEPEITTLDKVIETIRGEIK